MDVKVEGLAAIQAKGLLSLFLIGTTSNWAHTKNKTKNSAFLKPCIKFAPELKRQTSQGRAKREDDILLLYHFFFLTRDFMS